MVTEQSMLAVLKKLGICEGDKVLVHSSFKSLGEVEKGAETVISALQKAVGEDGTVIFPTLCKENFTHAYETWHIDKPSEIGYLTNYFRLLPGALRSDQATHSVAAMGKDAAYLTQTHGQTGKRYGIYGDTPFAADSPWEKMYQMNTKVIFIGVTLIKCTFRHYAEYCHMEECLKKIKDRPDYEALKDRVWCYDDFENPGVWPHINSLYVHEVLKEAGKLWIEQCGDAEITMVSSKDFVETSWELLKKNVPELLNAKWGPPYFEWIKDTGITF